MALYAKSLFAENYVVTSSVVSMSIAHASGSTIFGDTVDDSHTFTGNITASGNVSGSSTSTASFGYYQGITSFAGADGTELLFSGSAASTASFGMVENGSGRFYTSGSSLVFESPNLTDFKILQTGLGTNSAGPTITLGNNGQGNLNEGTLKFEIGRLVSNRGITANGASVNATQFNTVNERGTAGTALFCGTGNGGDGGGMYFGGGGAYDVRFSTTEEERLRIQTLGDGGGILTSGSLSVGGLTAGAVAHVTASGNISGSSTSTGSFGMVMVGGSVLEAADSFSDGTATAISGSVASTGSFGKLELPVVQGTVMRVGATQVAAGLNVGDAGARYVFNVDHSAPYVGLGILAQSEFPHHFSILNKTYRSDGNFNYGINFNQDNDGSFNMYLPSAQVLIDVNGNMELKPSTPAAGEGGISGSQFSSASFGRFDAVDGFYEGGSKISDYVFEPDYELRSLDEVETFISQSKHLPGVPGQDDIDSWNNMSLGSKQTLFLEKIEELTLYTLQLHKRIKELENN